MSKSNAEKSSRSASSPCFTPIPNSAGLAMAFACSRYWLLRVPGVAAVGVPWDACGAPKGTLTGEGDIIIRPSAAAESSRLELGLGWLLRRDLELPLEPGVAVFGVLLLAVLGVFAVASGLRSVEKPRTARGDGDGFGDAAAAAAAVDGITTPRLRWFSTTGVPPSLLQTHAISQKQPWKSSCAVGCLCIYTAGLAAGTAFGLGLAVPSEAIGAISIADAQATVRLEDRRCRPITTSNLSETSFGCQGVCEVHVYTQTLRYTRY